MNSNSSEGGMPEEIVMVENSKPDKPLTIDWLEDAIYSWDHELNPDKISALRKAAFQHLTRMKADLASAQPSAVQQEATRSLTEIRERWRERRWPSIGYFVHAQAYQDIQKLLEIVDGK